MNYLNGSTRLFAESQRHVRSINLTQDTFNFHWYAPSLSDSLGGRSHPVGFSSLRNIGVCQLYWKTEKLTCLYHCRFVCSAQTSQNFQVLTLCFTTMLSTHFPISRICRTFTSPQPVWGMNSLDLTKSM